MTGFRSACRRAGAAETMLHSTAPLLTTIAAQRPADTRPLPHRDVFPHITALPRASFVMSPAGGTRDLDDHPTVLPRPPLYTSPEAPGAYATALLLSPVMPYNSPSLALTATSPFSG